MRRIASHLLVAVLGLQSLAWGLCPCALGKALRTLAIAGPEAGTARPCCPRCRTESPSRPAPTRPADGAPGQGDDCPHCGALARGATSPTVSTPEAPLPSAMEVCLRAPAPRPEPAPVRAPGLLSGAPDHGPPDVSVETVVLTI